MDLTVTKTEASVATRYRDLTFTIPKGTQIGCILNTAIQSGQTGMISCTVPEDIYGADNTVVLLDRGSQAMGEYKTATLTYGKRRIFVVWSSIRTPEGVAIDIDSPGTALGRAGMGGHIDTWPLGAESAFPCSCPVARDLDLSSVYKLDTSYVR